MSRHRGYRQLVEADLDIMPLMNLFVVLIPMLLLSAVFVEMSAIEMNLPGEGENGKEQESLDLSIRLETDRYVVTGQRLRARHVDRSTEDPESALAGVLAEIRTQFPDEFAVRIESEQATRYQEIIDVMDLSREAGLAAISLVGSTPQLNSAR